MRVFSIQSQVEGINNQCACTPPDPSHAVGTNHVVVAINSNVTIFDKMTGAQIGSTKPLNVLFQGLPTNFPCYKRNDGDPMVAWDHLNGRFVVSQFTSVSPYFQCIAVSKTDDPTGSWWAYNVSLSPSQVMVVV